MRIKTWTAATLLALAVGPLWAADNSLENWDGLVAVKSKRLDAAYLAPGADFRPYTKIMVDPTEASFDKNWMKNMNDRREISRMVDDAKAREILEGARTNFADVFHEAFTKAGYTIVTAPGPDVLRVSPAITNLYVNAPDLMEPGRSRTYTANAGEATMVLELRDSMSNALLGRVLDKRETRESVGLQLANSVTNAADFRLLFRTWANICVKGLETLKAQSPIPETLTPGQKLD